jgi:hypothetical protein
MDVTRGLQPKDELAIELWVIAGEKLSDVGSGGNCKCSNGIAGENEMLQRISTARKKKKKQK